MNYKRAIDKAAQAGLNRLVELSQSDSSKGKFTGVAQDKLPEPVPKFNRAPSETVHEGGNNTFIVLGRDRPGGLLTGYGGKGDTGAGSIDIVVGRGGYDIRGENEDGTQTVINPDFEKDAARIHISQKSDVDKNFDLARGSGNAEAKSSVAVKADNVRMISREGIKLVTGVDDRNSQGGSSTARYGIDLIANNDDSDLQPIVKARNLVAALTEMRDEIDDLNGIVENVVRVLTTVLPVLMAHSHPSPGSPSVELAAVTAPAMIELGGVNYYSIIANKINSSRYKIVHLSPAGANYIGSRYNKTT